MYNIQLEQLWYSYYKCNHKNISFAIHLLFTKGCNTKPLQKEVDHHLDLDESRLQLRWPFGVKSTSNFLQCIIPWMQSISSYHCEEVLILHNKPHLPPPILLNDTKVGRYNVCIRRQHLEVITKPHSVCQLCGGRGTRDLHWGGRKGKVGGEREGNCDGYVPRQTMKNLQVTISWRKYHDCTRLYPLTKSYLCNVVEVRYLSSRFCSNWTSRANHSNFAWTRNYLVK